MRDICITTRKSKEVKGIKSGFYFLFVCFLHSRDQVCQILSSSVVMKRDGFFLFSSAILSLHICVHYIITSASQTSPYVNVYLIICCVDL